jgi:putative transposase
MPRKPRYSEQQIIRCVREVEAGAVSIDEMARRIGVHPRTLEKWRSKYEGMNGSEARRLRQLEDENRRLKHALGELTLDNQALREIVSKKL